MIIKKKENLSKVCKIEVFWEGHKNLPLSFYLVMSKPRGGIFTDFLAFSVRIKTSQPFLQY